jgi:signal transduction histidine kinase
MTTDRPGTTRPPATAEQRPGGQRRGLTVGVRTRILATVLALAGLGMGLTGVAGLLLDRGQLLDQIDAVLAAEASEFRVAAASVGAAGEARDPETVLRLVMQRQVPTAQESVLGVVDGRPAFVTPGPRPFEIEKDAQLLARIAALPAAEDTRIRQLTTSANGTVRFAAVQVLGGPAEARGTYVVAMRLHPVQEAMLSGARQHALLSVASLALIGAGGWLVAGRLLRPLRLLRDAATDMSHTDLTARIPVSGNDDVTDLTRTVNAMLDRLQDAFDAQQRFLDDAGHELRTPLTVIRGHLELLDVGDEEDVQATRALLMDELDRTARLVTDLIVLAQAGRPDFVRPGPVEIDRLLDDVLDKAAALADRTWVLEARSGLTVLADPQRLTQAMLQLADNASKHTRGGDLIAFGAAEAGGSVHLWVRDTGTGVRPEDADRIFQRFGRGVMERADGSGLGLSIVAGIATAHGGRVVLDPAITDGARFTLVLPLAVIDRAPRDRTRPGVLSTADRLRIEAEPAAASRKVAPR